MAKEKEATLTVEKGEKNQEPKIDQARVDAAKKAFDDFGVELQNKVYLVPGGSKTGSAILTFLEEKATWNAQESLGVIRAHEDVSAALKKSKKELFLGNLCIEAVAYYVSKETGTGLAAATKFKDELFIPINEAMAKIQEDKKTAENLQIEWAAAAQGVSVEDLKAYLDSQKGQR